MPRGNLTVAEKHQKRIALDTLRMSEIGAFIMGGIGLQEAVNILKEKYGYNNVILRNKLTRYGYHPRDIERLLS